MNTNEEMKIDMKLFENLETDYEKIQFITESQLSYYYNLNNNIKKSIIRLDRDDYTDDDLRNAGFVIGLEDSLEEINIDNMKKEILLNDLNDYYNENIVYIFHWVNELNKLIA